MSNHNHCLAQSAQPEQEEEEDDEEEVSEIALLPEAFYVRGLGLVQQLEEFHQDHVFLTKPAPFPLCRRFFHLLQTDLFEYQQETQEPTPASFYHD